MLGTRVLWSRPRTFRMIAFDLSRGASRSPLGPESRLGGAILLTDVRWRGKPVAGDRPQALLAAGGSRSVRAEELIDLVLGRRGAAQRHEACRFSSRGHATCAVPTRSSATAQVTGSVPRLARSTARGSRGSCVTPRPRSTGTRPRPPRSPRSPDAHRRPARGQQRGRRPAGRGPQDGRRGSVQRPPDPGAGLQPDGRAPGRAARARGGTRGAAARRTAAGGPAAQRGCRPRPGGRARAIRALPAGAARRAGHRPRCAAPADTARPAGARQAGPPGRQVRRDRPDRPRRRPGPAAGADGRLPGGVHRRRRRARQDPAGAGPRA